MCLAFYVGSRHWTLVLMLTEQALALDWQSSPQSPISYTYSALLYSPCAICHSLHYAIYPEVQQQQKSYSPCLIEDLDLRLLFAPGFSPSLPPSAQITTFPLSTSKLHIQMRTCHICFSMFGHLAFASPVYFVTKKNSLKKKFKPNLVYCILFRQLAHFKSH